MIALNNKTLVASYYMSLAISKIAYGAKILWEKITSCFGSGTWNATKPWISNENWKN